MPGVSGELTADFADFQRACREAAGALKKMEDGGKSVETGFNDMTKTMKGMASDVAAAFGIAFGIDAIVGFGAAILEDASALKTLSSQTHISVEDLQILTGALSEFGVDADELGRGLAKLSQGIAGGDESVAGGLHKMGLSLKDVEGLKGKDLFLAIMDGLSTLQGGLRDSAAADLFGAKLGTAMAGASEDIRGTMQTWQDLNHVTSTEAVNALDEFGSAIARSKANLSAIAAEMVGPVAEGFNVLFDAAAKGATKWDLAMSYLPKGFAGIGTGVEGLNKILTDQALKQADVTAATIKGALAHGDATKAIDTRTASEKFMAALQADAAKALTAQQTADLARLKELGELTGKNAAAIGVNAAQYAKYQADQAAATKAAEKATRDHEQAVKDITESEKKRFDAEMKHQTELRKTENQHGIDLLNEAAEAYGQMKEVKDRYYDSVAKSSMDASTYQITKIWDTAKAQVAAFKGTAEDRAIYADLTYSIAETEAKAITDLMASAVDTMTGLASSGLKKVKDEADAAVKGAQQYSMVGGQQLSQAQWDEYYKTPQGIQDIIRNNGKRYYATSGGSPELRAAGGPVSAGVPYMVGEQGPELFMPAQGGTIYPHGAGGVTTVINITQPLGDPRLIARAVEDAMNRSLRTSGVRLPAGA